MSNTDTSYDPGPAPLVIQQPRTGYRYNIDSFLLASFVILKKRATVIDLGSGVGVIGLLLCARYPDCSVWGIEIQERLFRFAQENSRQNGLEDRLKNIRGDLRRPLDLPSGVLFDAAVSNPPYRPVGTGRRNKDEERTVARHETNARLSDIIESAGRVLKPAGRLSLIYPAWRMADVVTLLRSGGFEPKRARFIHARRSEGAQMVMIEAQRHAGIQLTVLPPLYIWEDTGIYTGEVTDIMKPARANSY